MPKVSKMRSLPEYPDYINGGNPSVDLMIQKANPLQTLSETSMTLAEFKILDLYLSRINSHEPEKRNVCIEKGELERLLGVTRILQDDLEKRIDNLFQILTIRDPAKEGGFTKISLFSRAECKKDASGQWKINLACSPEAMEYFFNIDTIGYLKYRLKNVIGLTSRYSYILYLYLEANKFRKEWVLPLDDLKQMLNCTAETYEEFKEFNAKILKKCYKEINDKTSLSYEYTSIRSNRKVSGIKFTVATNEIQYPDQLDTISDIPVPVIAEMEEGSTKIISKLFVACEMSFTTDELQSIYSLISTSRIPDRITGEDQDTRCYNYFRQMYAKYKQAEKTHREKGSRINRSFDYFMKLITNDLQEGSQKKSESPKKLETIQSYDLSEFKKFSVTFSGNTKKVMEEKRISDERFNEYKSEIDGLNTSEEGLMLMGKISLDTEFDNDLKEKLTELVKERLKSLN